MVSKISELYGLMNNKPEGLLGVSVHNKKEWKYFIAVSSTEDSDNFEQYHIPVATWAVFSGRGTNVSLQELERRVITEWLDDEERKFYRRISHCIVALQGCVLAFLYGMDILEYFYAGYSSLILVAVFMVLGKISAKHYT